MFGQEALPWGCGSWGKDLDSKPHGEGKPRGEGKRSSDKRAAPRLYIPANLGLRFGSKPHGDRQRLGSRNLFRATPRIDERRRCGSSSTNASPTSPRSPAAAPPSRPSRGIDAIARAHAQEYRDTALVQSLLPERIDALLPTEFQLAFEHGLYEHVAEAAHSAARCSPEGATAVAKQSMLDMIEMVIETLEGMEARANARANMATAGGGVVKLDEQSRKDLVRGFSDVLAEVVSDTLPQIARIANPVSAVEVQSTAWLKKRNLRESWQAVLDCKTQITELYQDNDYLSEQRQSELLGEAVQLLEVPKPPPFRAADSADVIRFLTSSIQRCAADDLRQRAVGRLAGLLICRGTDGPGPTWVRAAAQVVAGVAARAEEEQAAVRLQAFYRGWASRKTWRRQRQACAHESLGQRLSTPLELKGPVALVESLLRQAAALVCRPRSRWGLVQLQRSCSALGDIRIEALHGRPDAALAFWLNVRNLGAMLAVLLAPPGSSGARAPRGTCARPSQGLPTTMSGRGNVSPLRRNSKSRISSPPAVAWPPAVEAWLSTLRSGTLCIGGTLLSPNDIDHLMLRLGPAASLPSARRVSMGAAVRQRRCGEAECRDLGDGGLEDTEPWAAFGLWLPVRFGLPPLRIYRPEAVKAQLRLNAAALVAECSEAALLAGEGNAVLAPPLLRAPGLPDWRPLLLTAALGDADAAGVEEVDVDWTFDPRRLALVGAEVSWVD